MIVLDDGVYIEDASSIIACDEYVRFYDEVLTRVDEWGEEVLQTDCVF